MNIDDYYKEYESRITRVSERIFIDVFLYPLLGDKIEKIIPQYPFLDNSGRSRRIDFACYGYVGQSALEVNGESYHAESIIPNEMFDENLYRQNKILRAGYKLARFFYSQLFPPLLRPYAREEEEASINRLRNMNTSWPGDPQPMQPNDLNILRELFGAVFFTPRYMFEEAVFLEEL